MNKHITSKLMSLLSRRELKERLGKVAMVLSCFAVFCITYILVAPVLTEEWPAVCGMEEHTHDDSCYTEQLVEPTPELICGLEESGHVHTDSCYTAVRGDLMCTETGTEEEPHVHDDSCYAWSYELVCTESTEGHIHDESCYGEPAEPYMERVLICELPEHTHTDSCYHVPEENPAPDYICGFSTEHTHTEECYFEDGSLKCTVPEHIHTEDCVKSADTEELTAPEYICGFLTEHTHDENCYLENGELGCDIPEHTHSDECLPETVVLTLDETYHYQTDIASIDFHITGETSCAIDPAAGEDIPLDFIVTESEDQTEYDAYEELVSEDGDVLAMQILHFSLNHGEQALDLSGCEITADITPTEMLREYAENGSEIMTLDVDGEDANTETADMGVLLAASGSEDAYESAVLDEENDGTITVPVSGYTLRTAAVTGENPKFTVQYYAQLNRVSQTNPGGKVTALDIINTDGGSAPATDADGQVVGIGKGIGGANLPKNGVTPNTANLYIKQDGTLTTTTELTQIYRDEEFEYFQAPGLLYFNIVINNTESNYDTFQIWVLKDGKDANSLNEADWEVYDYDAKTTRFTNRPETVQPGNGYILIKQNMVIRLVYKPAQEEYSNDARFYDYDISDGPTGTNTMTTTQNGINKAATNGTGTRLTFGNGNAGVNTSLTILPSATWNGNYLNVYNRKKDANGVNIKENGNLVDLGYKGCTFGLVSGLTDDKDDVKFSSGIAAPSLFGKKDCNSDEGAINGKTITNIDGLTFKRVGDTYTLKAVPKANLDNLDVLGHPGGHENIWTNNFFPVDNATTKGEDLMFGGSNPVKGSSGNLPASDDGKEHNSYFGMHFGVSFKLTKGYVGPLEYYFFGDDDMWVFLEYPVFDAEKNELKKDADGNIVYADQLICDIGGVHAAVGEYVNLWDYIDARALNTLDKDENGKDEKLVYKLKFFYTERGASGSTCWMQFTLPTVVGLDLDEYLNQKVTESTGALRIEKQLDGVENTQDFEFKLSMKNQQGEYLPDNYMVRGANGELLEGDAAKTYIANGETFKLKAGDVLVIHGLPGGTEYTITEINNEGYHTESATWLYNAEKEAQKNGTELQKTVTTGTIATGQITVNDTTKVVFTNHATYELPATGGSGTAVWYIMGGLLALTGLCLLVYSNKQKRGKATI